MSLQVALQPRDLSLLQGLFESRVMTLAHISALYFEEREEAAKKRMQKLKAAGFIGERPRRASEPAIHFLTRKGFSVLKDEGLLSKYPPCSPESFEKRVDVSALTLQHELCVMDVKMALTTAIRQKPDRFPFIEFSTWPAMHSFKATHPETRELVVVKPDGFIRLHENEPDGGLSEHCFFLECDRSTESQEKLAIKAHCYGEYYRRGGFAEKHDASPEQYKAFPFRVLFVVPADERRDNAAKRLLKNNPPVFTMVWITTFKEMLENPLGDIWVRPDDFKSERPHSAFAAKHLFA